MQPLFLRMEFLDFGLTHHDDCEIQVAVLKRGDSFGRQLHQVGSATSLGIGSAETFQHDF